jgi:hypothetical protein
LHTWKSLQTFSEREFFHAQLEFRLKKSWNCKNRKTIFKSTFLSVNASVKFYLIKSHDLFNKLNSCNILILSKTLRCLKVNHFPSGFGNSVYASWILFRPHQPLVYVFTYITFGRLLLFLLLLFVCRFGVVLVRICVTSKTHQFICWCCFCDLSSRFEILINDLMDKTEVSFMCELLSCESSWSI